MSGQRPMIRVLRDLQARFVAGLLVPGQPLPVAELSQFYRLSATPIREALAHLAGEGLVEESQGRGYVCRRMDEGDYRGLCDVQEWLLHAAMVWRGPVSAPDLREGLQRRTATLMDAAANAAWVFSRAIAMSGSRTLGELYAPVNGRLGFTRRLETDLIAGSGFELETLALVLGGGDVERALAGSAVYHERRRAAAARICDGLRDSLEAWTTQDLSSFG